MSRSTVERRLAELGARTRELRQEAQVASEQLAHLDAEVEEARVRALVAEGRSGEREVREAQRHADAMRRHRQQITDELVRLEAAQDELLDRLLER